MNYHLPGAFRFPFPPLWARGGHPGPHQAGYHLSNLPGRPKAGEVSLPCGLIKMADGCTATALTETAFPLRHADEVTQQYCYHRKSQRALESPCNDPGTRILTGENHQRQHFPHIPTAKRQSLRLAHRASFINEKCWEGKRENPHHPLTAWYYSTQTYLATWKPPRTLPTLRHRL
ncbi:Hypothetical predicted protein [Pelobates cultripes]|uniref:Uncharacterized protein n=1 Tax=Pelobates cultripes TaxID=61616 RepID=A0AAD1R1I3_PELCU|nr:Hypothetical predicted protein [Pelobates cultripes]